MKTHSRKQKRLRWLRIGATVAFVALIALVLTGWLALTRIPSWYKPAIVLQSDLDRVRNSLPNAYQELADRVVEGKEFELTFEDRTVNEWIAARAEMYPESAEWLPDFVRQPAVSFDDDRCIIAARIDYDGWKFILGVQFSATADRNRITIHIDGLTVGAMPVPLAIVRGPLERLLASAQIDTQDMAEPAASILQDLQGKKAADIVEDGIGFRNSIKPPNTNRYVRITGLSAEDGKLLVRMQPFR